MPRIKARCHFDALGNFVTRAVRRTLADEEGHIDFLETRLSLFGTLGAERCGLLSAIPARKAA